MTTGADQGLILAFIMLLGGIGAYLASFLLLARTRRDAEDHEAGMDAPAPMGRPRGSHPRARSRRLAESTPW